MGQAGIGMPADAGMPPLRLLDNGICDGYWGVVMHRDPGVNRVPASTNIVADYRPVDHNVAAVIIGDKEYCRTILVDHVLLDERTVDSQRHRVAVIVDSTAGPASGCAGTRRIAAKANSLVMTHDAIDDRPGYSNATNRSATGCNIT